MISGIDEIEKELLALQEAKDNVMDLSREVVRQAGKAITFIHADDKRGAAKALEDLRASAKKLQKIDKGFEYNSIQAHQEYVEACALSVMVNESRIPSMEELDANCVSYLLGLLDSVGELKRYSTDRLRKNERAKAEKCYDLMLEIYDSTVPMRFANSLVPEFRKKQDVARTQIERLSSELLLSRSDASL
ncbi:MAG: hypothetical protein M1321_02360 [Candidatus Marsarchaeota archaeon]|nr:hypothetical protein [Candidatus Marsarchaeota archaeon]